MITKQALGSLLFGMADILRDKVEDYKSYILSLLFFKRLSDNYQFISRNLSATSLVPISLALPVRVLFCWRGGVGKHLKYRKSRSC